MIKHESGGRTLRKIVVAGIAALSFAAAVEGIKPAQALPIAPIVSQTADIAMPGIAHVYYYYRRPFYRPYYGYRRFYGYRRAVPCRGGLNSHLSKRYC